jgi:DNA-binding GntR family transcriptional regulator
MNDANVGPVRVLLKDQAYEELKKLIMNEVFSPGTFFSVRQLAARVDMSKTPIRSALERLESEGFVAVSP